MFFENVCFAHRSITRPLGTTTTTTTTTTTSTTTTITSNNDNDNNDNNNDSAQGRDPRGGVRSPDPEGGGPGELQGRLLVRREGNLT